jgi:hypothetical protein
VPAVVVGLPREGVLLPVELAPCNMSVRRQPATRLADWLQGRSTVATHTCCSNRFAPQ